MDKVRLTENDLAKGDKEMAEKRMNSGDGGLAKHSTTCKTQHTMQNTAQHAKHSPPC